MARHNLQWLTKGSPNALSHGISFGMPWPKGRYQPDQSFSITVGGQTYPISSRALALWADGSLKWTVHSVSGEIAYSDTYLVEAADRQIMPKSDITVDEFSRHGISISNARGLRVNFFSDRGHTLLESILFDGRCVCAGADIVASINKREFFTVIKGANIESLTYSRVVVKVSGVVTSEDGTEHLPFDVRVYVHSHASSVKIVHSFIHDLGPYEPLTSLGLRFRTPLANAEFYNRHIRLAGSNGGILKEEVQGLSGLRHGPTVQNRLDQTAGKPVVLGDGNWTRTELSRGLSYVPCWDSYSVSQLSSDGFTIKKRTKGGSWVKVTGGGRADGIAYVGSAHEGGLAVGMVDFWERYPTQLDLTDLTQNTAAITVWLYSPLAEPLDTAPYHDGLGQNTYEKQLQALDVTYEDYEPGFATANGIARTNHLVLQPFLSTPTNAELSDFASLVRSPPRLVPSLDYIYSAGVFHGCWSPRRTGHPDQTSQKERDIDRNLDLLFNFYESQVEQNRWYGFWDHGDIQHTYDPFRHGWRYDVGGFAWDNSELSTDLWLWLYFLRTGRADVFKMAEAMTRHTSEVDVYHTGRFKGFGTRHGVQHWSDSSKQLRISNVLYRRIYYYLTGDERMGDVISELQDCQHSLLILDSHRKVQQHAPIPEGFAMANIGLDGGALMASWLTAWERRTEGWEHAQHMLLNFLDGIANLRHGIGNNAVLLNPHTGEMRSCPPPTPEYAISHLSMLFGFPEICTELLDYAKDAYPDLVKRFKKVWLAYCRAYNGGPLVQKRIFGFEFPQHATWRQSHSTLTALAAVEQGSAELARDAWDQFFSTDGYNAQHSWTITRVGPPEYFCVGEEATWITTNEAARYGVSAIVNLANIRDFL
ncbi:hypothetical protein BDV59DRAFT_199736 [Aspergillus ambiguus]|uniref:polysaccharide lyase family 26 protein n=1 Tax=Aspergillus ambiguus TaxID=176160 RepID=UPI003CCE1340